MSTLPDLVDHIIKTHHRYVRDATPALTRRLHTLVNRHGLERLELPEIERTFVDLGQELLAHLDKEECILFPYICELAAAERAHGARPPSPFGTIANPLRMMEVEHRSALERLEVLRDLTKSYTPPSAWPSDDAGVYLSLAAFDADFQRHVELENSLLFPRALDLEERLA